jgi:cytochrome c peroxidase
VSDSGLYKTTKNLSDIGRFKSPTLRNIALTAPYMHDSRFETLEEVIIHYSFGLENSTTIDPLMKKIANGGVQLSALERANLLAFLKTLTDDDFLTNPEYANPF